MAQVHHGSMKRAAISSRSPRYALTSCLVIFISSPLDFLLVCSPYIRGQWGTSASSRRKTSHGEGAPSVHPFADQQLTNPTNLSKWSNLPTWNYNIYMGFSTWSVCGVWELLILACLRTGLEPVDVWSAILKPHWQVKIACNINCFGVQ